MNNKVLYAILGILIASLICVCCSAVAVIAVSTYGVNQLFTQNQSTITPTPVVVRPSETPLPSPSVDIPSTPIPEFEESISSDSEQVPVVVEEQDQVDTMTAFLQAQIPVNDPIDLTERFLGINGISRYKQPTDVALPAGSQASFWVMDADVNQFKEVQATLQYVTDHMYLWIEDSVKFDPAEVKAISETFENEIYPTNRTFFGSEWTPGVDGDQHLYILYTPGLGRTVAGYFSPGDEYPFEASEYSNEHEMFFLSSERLDLDNEYTYGVLAHEFQHMIHWNRDANEETWMNEGFAQLAMFLNEYDIGNSDVVYMNDPDLQLTSWPTEVGTSYPNYGSSFLFLLYFLDRFGEEATKQLVSNPENGMESIDTVLENMGINDPITGEMVTADDVFSDWAVASILLDPEVSDGRYTYNDYPQAPQPSVTDDIKNCPTDVITRDVHQYGIDYIRVNCPGNYNLEFIGSIQVGVLPEDPYSGDFSFYSNRGDESDIRLTRKFDFTDQMGPLTLDYWTWYDIEKDYDYLYLVASTDGENWEILRTPSGTDEDPSGNSYGWGYNGTSGNGPAWINETVDLSQYAGQEVQIRFEYVTDAAANGEGFLLDDVSIPEIEYFTDFEEDDGGWEAEGFVRIENILPQGFNLSVISMGNEDTTVEHIELQDDNTALIPINIGNGFDEVILVISGNTRYTQQNAAYQIEIRNK